MRCSCTDHCLCRRQPQCGGEPNGPKSPPHRSVQRCRFCAFRAATGACRCGEFLPTEAALWGDRPK
eukprot:14282408-Alexandrium_andersonii.AAC.1